MINVMTFYKKNVKKNEYYYKFYHEIVTDFERTRAEYAIFEDASDLDIQYEFYNIDDIIDHYKKILQPDSDYYALNRIYILLSFYLYKNGYTIDEFPRILERPEAKLEDFAYKEIRRRLVEMDKLNNQGQISYATRREFISKLHFSKNIINPIIINDDIKSLFKKISNSEKDFLSSTKDEKIREISNLIENMLKSDDGSFKSYNYNDISFDYIDNEIIHSYRKLTQCFRHAHEKALEQRKEFNDNQKDFLIEYGLVIINLIHKFINK